MNSSDTPARSRPRTRRPAPPQATAAARTTTSAATSAVTSSATATTSSSAVGVSFADLGIPTGMVRLLDAQGITTPFPIQAATLRDSMAGRDVLGRGRTGSGKTLAFALPMITRLTESGNRRRPNRPRALVLAPTRELATQISDTVRPLADTAGLTVTTIFGGVPQGRQTKALSAGVDIVIACPGRLEDLMGQRAIFLDEVEITVLDEADHMADLGFLPGVKRILSATPSGIQRLLFSATLDKGVNEIVKRFLDRPVTHSVDPAESPISTMTHHVLSVPTRDDKTAVVRELASGTGRRMLFMRTKHSAKKLAQQLTASGIPAVDLHGNLTQGARQRNLAAFSEGSVKVLVCTDIAARGIHVDDIELVIHVDPPTEHKAYLHRSGRTARAGSEGTVVTLMLPDQQRDVATLMRQARIEPTTSRASAGAPAVSQLVGTVAAHVEPAVRVGSGDYLASSGGGAPRSRPSGGARPAAARGGYHGTPRPGTESRSGGRRGRSGGAARRGPR